MDKLTTDGKLKALYQLKMAVARIEDSIMPSGVAHPNADEYLALAWKHIVKAQKILNVVSPFNNTIESNKNSRFLRLLSLRNAAWMELGFCNQSRSENETN